MKLLIDENLPKRLKEDFPEHQIFTVREMGWNSKKNGELLSLMLGNRFDVLLTFDRNLQFKQNFMCIKLFFSGHMEFACSAYSYRLVFEGHAHFICIKLFSKAKWNSHALVLFIASGVHRTCSFHVYKIVF